MGENRSCRNVEKGVIRKIVFKKSKKFYGRRKGRRISSTNLKLLEDYSNKFYLQEDQICKLAP